MGKGFSKNWCINRAPFMDNEIGSSYVKRVGMSDYEIIKQFGS